MSGLGRLMSALLIALVRAYQVLLSPWMGGHCRFHPSCSQYAIEALGAHGPIRGAFLAARRVLRCHPFAKGGYDPPPVPRRSIGRLGGGESERSSVPRAKT